MLTFKDIYANIPKFDNVLEAKLELLHDCLEFGEKPPVLSSLLEEHKEAYNSFLAAVKDKKITDTDLVQDENDKKKLDEDNKGYIQALTNFRIKLFGE